jgi:trimeric autotransporter adhesin
VTGEIVGITTGQGPTPRPQVALDRGIVLRFLVFFLTFGAPAMAVTTDLNWNWSNPAPFGNNIADLAWRTNRYYLAACDRGRLYFSDDGVAWFRATTSTRRALRGVTFLNDRAIVTGEQGLVLWSDETDFRTVQLPTTRWLESVAASTNLAVAVGDAGEIWTSTNGVLWQVVAPDLTTNNLRSVVFGEDRFVNVGENGFVAVSFDGETWTASPSGVTNHLNRVQWTPPDFTIVGDGGVVLFGGTNGGGWRRQSPGATGPLYATSATDIVPALGAGERLIAGDGDVFTGIPRSGFLWSNERQQLDPPPDAAYFASVWDGAQFMLGGHSGILVTGQRPAPNQGYAWTPISTGTRRWLWAVTTNSAVATNVTAVFIDGVATRQTTTVTNTFYVAAGADATLLESDSGAEWAAALVPTNAAGGIYLGIASAPNAMVAVGSGGLISQSPVSFLTVVTNVVLTNDTEVISVPVTNLINTLGIVWQPAVSGVTNDLQGIAVLSNRWVACGAAGTILVSSNLTSWVRVDSKTTSFLSTVETTGTGWIAAGDNGTLLTSADSLQWRTLASGTTGWIWRVRRFPDVLIAVGENGLILTSTNGADWSRSESGVTNWLNDVVFVADTFYAVGNQGTVLASDDARRWVNIGTITGRSLYGAATIDGQLVAVGFDGTILRSQVVPFVTPVRFLDFPREPESRLFLFGGRLDQRFRFDRGTNLPFFTNGAIFEITRPDGTLLIFDRTSNATNHQFFRIRSE